MGAARSIRSLGSVWCAGSGEAPAILAAEVYYQVDSRLNLLRQKAAASGLTQVEIQESLGWDAATSASS